MTKHSGVIYRSASDYNARCRAARRKEINRFVLAQVTPLNLLAFKPFYWHDEFFMKSGNTIVLATAIKLLIAVTCHSWRCALCTLYIVIKFRTILSKKASFFYILLSTGRAMFFKEKIKNNGA